MFVKICGLRSEEHVQAAIDGGADAVGFVFADSVRRVEPAHAARIADTVPGTVKKVAVMRHPSAGEWRAVLSAFSPDVLQTDADDFVGLDVPDGIGCWPVVREGNTVTDMSVATLRASTTFIYEGARSGAGETVDWDTAAKFAKRGNMILAGGLGASNVAAAIACARPYGVDVSSAVETAPGQKDSELIRDFIVAAKAAGKEL